MSARRLSEVTEIEKAHAHYGVPMSSELELVQRQVDAFNAHDIDGFLACYAVDAVVRHGDGRTLMTGKDEMRAFFGPAFLDVNLRAEVVNRVHCGAWVVDEERTTSTGKVFQGLAAYEVREGLIRSMVMLADVP